MTRGRKPTPTSLRRKAGNPGKRGFNAPEPVPPEGMPDCPPHLSELARAEWQRIASSGGVLSNLLKKSGDRHLATAAIARWTLWR